MSAEADRVLEWLAAGETAALATVTATDGSTPRAVGSRFAVRATGEVAGSISAGCVEAEVHATALEVLATGEPRRARFGRPGADGLAAPLMCGGSIEVRVERVGPQDLTRLTAERDARRRTWPRLIVYGAVDIAGHLADLGAMLDRAVTVCDARATFTSASRFPSAEQVVVDWPHRHLAAELSGGRADDRTAVVSLAHDAKFETPLLVAALRAPLAYVGALGSRATHADRLDRLRAAGATPTELALLHAPIGLDLGGTTPAETALSVAAEIVAVTRGGTGSALSDVGHAIHRRSA